MTDVKLPVISEDEKIIINAQVRQLEEELEIEKQNVIASSENLNVARKELTRMSAKCYTCEKVNLFLF